MVDFEERGGTLMIRRQMRPFVTASRWSQTALMCQESMKGADSTYFQACLTNSWRLSSAFCRRMSSSIFRGPPARRIRSSMRRACSRWALASADMGFGRLGGSSGKAVVRGASGTGGVWDPCDILSRIVSWEMGPGFGSPSGGSLHRVSVAGVPLLKGGWPGGTTGFPQAERSGSALPFATS